MVEIIFPRDGVENAEEISRREEAAYREKIERAARMTIESGAKFVFLAGPSCSGKTTTSLSLAKSLEEKGLRAITFSTDDFFFNGDRAPKNEDGTPNYDAFEHTDSHYILSVLTRLHKNEAALLPVFDFATGCRSDKTVTILPEEHDVFILEGIHALNDAIVNGLPREAKKICFYLDVTCRVRMAGEENFLEPDEVRFCRRLIRDFKHRFADGDRTFSLWKNVLRSEKEILHPYRKNAAFVIETNFSYEIPVEKAEAIELLEKVSPDGGFFNNAEKIKEKLMPFPTLEEALVPKNSVLREFID